MRMIKRILTITLNLFFIVTTTGAPIYLRFCNTSMGKDSHEIGIYLNENTKDQIDNCTCAEKQHNYVLGSMNCCKYVSLSPLIKDKYISLKTGPSRNLHFATIVDLSSSNTVTIKNTSKLFADHLSPPAQKDNQIYLDNSILLI